MTVFYVCLFLQQTSEASLLVIYKQQKFIMVPWFFNLGKVSRQKGQWAQARQKETEWVSEGKGPKHIRIYHEITSMIMMWYWQLILIINWIELRNS